MIWWRCSRCGEVLRSWTAAQRHADEHGGARLEWEHGEEPA